MTARRPRQCVVCDSPIPVGVECRNSLCRVVRMQGQQLTELKLHVDALVGDNR